MPKANVNSRAPMGSPPKQGLYDPQFEHDSCGIGFVVNIKGKKSHQIVADGLQILMNLDHRGAVGHEPNTGDGAGILIQTPHEFLVKVTAKLGFKLPAFGDYGVGMLFLPKICWSATPSRRRSPRLFPPRARRCSAGATCRRTIRRSAKPPSPPSRTWRRCSSGAIPS